MGGTSTTQGAGSRGEGRPRNQEYCPRHLQGPQYRDRDCYNKRKYFISGLKKFRNIYTYHILGTPCWPQRSSTDLQSHQVLLAPSASPVHSGTVVESLQHGSNEHEGFIVEEMEREGGGGREGSPFPGGSLACWVALA